jgi:uncharacterized protein
MEFEWNEDKNFDNVIKHGISFFDAQSAFFDPKRVITIDIKHSTKNEKRYFCFGSVNNKILTLLFTVRSDKIRIFGAGYWREGREKYERENKL